MPSTIIRRFANAGTTSSKGTGTFTGDVWVDPVHNTPDTQTLLSDILNVCQIVLWMVLDCLCWWSNILVKQIGDLGAFSALIAQLCDPLDGLVNEYKAWKSPSDGEYISIAEE